MIEKSLRETTQLSKWREYLLRIRKCNQPKVNHGFHSVNVIEKISFVPQKAPK